MNIDFDCIIVGAGPAGATTAYHLAKLGHSVLIIEKQSLPRYKPCGGGVSPEIQKWFDFDFSPVISTKTSTFRCSWKMGSSVEGKIDDDFEPLWMVHREEFDYFIIKKAVDAGAVIIDKLAVKNSHFVDGIWSIETHKSLHTCRYLIAADGSGGPMAKILGFNRRKYCKYKALEVEVKQESLEESIVYLDFGSMDKGYAWNFPKNDAYSIGIGGEAKNLKKLLQVYMDDQFNIDLTTQRLFGHTINAWNGKNKLHSRQALLVGEAACLVDPFTAEGIRPSIHSGVLAAQAIDQALLGKEMDLSLYSKNVHKEIGKEMFWASLLARFFFIAPHLAFQAIVSQPSATNAMGKIMNGQLKYSQVASKAVKKVLEHYHVIPSLSKSNL